MAAADELTWIVGLRIERLRAQIIRTWSLRNKRCRAKEIRTFSNRVKSIWLHLCCRHAMSCSGLRDRCGMNE